MNAPEFCAGVARRNITPETSIWMSGYPFRDRPSEGALHPLWAKALAIEDSNRTRVVIVATDLIALPRDITDLVSMRVQQRYGIERSQIMFNSTHTHSGPVVWPNLNQNKYPFFNNGIGAPGNPAIFYDNHNRPGRIFTWSIGVQRELRDFRRKSPDSGRRPGDIRRSRQPGECDPPET